MCVYLLCSKYAGHRFDLTQLVITVEGPYTWNVRKNTITSRLFSKNDISLRELELLLLESCH